MRYFKYILFLSLLQLAVGCQTSDVDEYVVPSNLSKGAQISFSIANPSVSQVASRSEDAAVEAPNELTIQRGYIFIFEQSGALRGFQKVAKSDVEKNGTQYPVITTNVAGYDQLSDKIIAVFNYSETLFGGENFGSLTKEAVSDHFPMDGAYLKALQADLTSGAYLLGMPMFVNDFDDTNNNSIHEIYRALARIELFVKDTDVSTSLVGHSHNFTTENVKFSLVNCAESGEIGFSSRAEVKGKVSGALYEAGVDLEYDHLPTKFTSRESVLSAAPSANTIYLYEFPYSKQVITGDAVANSDYAPERLSIIIEHEDKVAHPDDVFYYKLQLVDRVKNEYLDIKRNHDYRVVITNVYSDGYLDADEAYTMPPSNIEYEIYDDQGDLTFSNGQYAISMDEVLNYESVTIYGPNTMTLSFDNIRRILPAEVTDPLTDAELAEMTNIVDFAVVSHDKDLLVDVVRNDFSGDKRLTDQGRSIVMELSGSGSCVIRLKIRLGNLEMGFDQIAIQKIGSEFGGDSSFDAHPCQLRIENQKVIAGTWNSIDSDFGARNDGNDMIVYMGENATPVGYKSLNGYISSGAAANAYPYFEPKTRSGYFSYYDLAKDPEMTTVKKSKIVLNQLAPFYVGHFGSKAKSGPHYYDALIVEKIEEIKETRADYEGETGGLMNWSEKLGMIYYPEEKIYGEYLGLKKYLNLSEGLEIANYIVENGSVDGYMPLAAKYCYMKNDIDGDGEIEPNEPVVWFLPASNQMLAMWVSKYLIDSEVDAKYFGFHLEHDNTPWYWTCSEVAPTDWDITLSAFGNNIARFNMLEGELSIGGRKGENGYDDLAHVRCVRGIVYDNTKGEY